MNYIATARFPITSTVSSLHFPVFLLSLQAKSSFLWLKSKDVVLAINGQTGQTIPDPNKQEKMQFSPDVLTILVSGICLIHIHE